MFNTITNDNGDTIGFYQDLKVLLISEIEEELKHDNYAVLGDDRRELLEELDHYKESEELLIISENNGMGYTVKTYIESFKK